MNTQNLFLPSADMFRPWNNIVINQSYLKNKFIIFVKFRLKISVCCLCHSSIISSDFRDCSWLSLGLAVGKLSRLHFWIKMLFQGQKYMLTQQHIQLSKIRTCKWTQSSCWSSYVFLFHVTFSHWNIVHSAQFVIFFSFDVSLFLLFWLMFILNYFWIINCLNVLPM